MHAPETRKTNHRRKTQTPISARPGRKNFNHLPRPITIWPGVRSRNHRITNANGGGGWNSHANSTVDNDSALRGDVWHRGFCASGRRRRRRGPSGVLRFNAAHSDYLWARVQIFGNFFFFFLSFVWKRFFSNFTSRKWGNAFIGFWLRIVSAYTSYWKNFSWWKFFHTIFSTVGSIFTLLLHDFY